MSLGSMLFSLLIKPLEMLFEVIFSYAHQFIGDPGLAIIFLSLAINLLVLPLYRRADAMQEEERLITQKLSRGVSHIKKTFRGDEQMMMLQTYYRQNDYKPTYVLRGAVSLFLEIPFFIAAYRFLSGLELLQGAAFGPVADLGAPDRMISLGALRLNLLPVIMTLVNLVSSYIFTRGYPLRTKIQLYGMALFFLVFLYNSPSGLVFYWTLNNLFSLVKTVFYKLRDPRRVLRSLAAALGAVMAVLGAVFSSPILLVPGVILFAGALLKPLADRISLPGWDRKPDPGLFFRAAAFLTVLLGLLIPSGVISSSPQEFAAIRLSHNPVWYVVSSALIGAGTFLVWMNVFYRLSDDRGKLGFEYAVTVIAAAAILDYMCFGRDMGLLSTSLQFDDYIFFTLPEKLWNIAAIIACAAVVFILSLKNRRLCSRILTVAVLSMCVLSGVNLVRINRDISALQENAPGETLPDFRLSREGQNVFVIMLDRAMGEYMPYILNEKPELKEQFDGFTYYANTLSFGDSTNFGSPALFGGYEYTPAELNLRDTESLVTKQNEALRVLPVLFSENGYDTTVCDPSLENYMDGTLPSAFAGYPRIRAASTHQYSMDSEEQRQYEDEKIALLNRNLFCYSVVRALPLALRSSVYQSGVYRAQKSSCFQVSTSSFTATGIDYDFLMPYKRLGELGEMCTVSDDPTGSFSIIVNDTAHNPAMLQTPDYTPAQIVDNREYYEANRSLYTLDGVTLRCDSYNQTRLYDCNMASLMQIGKWLDALRDMGVYDNTRIIIVADHGSQSYQVDELVFSQDGVTVDIAGYYPLLLVKDFDSAGFTVSEEFMTNADVPALAVEGLISDPVNPFTGKAIDSSEKTAHPQYIADGDLNYLTNNGSTFKPCLWFTVSDDMRLPENWSLAATDAVLTSEAYR